MQNKHHRKSIRLKGYDYSQQGCYFVTICTKNRMPLFGEIAGGEMNLNFWGRITDECWQAIPDHYPHVSLDEYVIMPNHIHGIIVINPSGGVGVQNVEPLRHEYQINQYQHIIPKSLGSIVRGFEIGVTKWFRHHTDIHTVWQRNFHDHVIRNEEGLNRIRQYIMDNPKNWEKDEFFG